MIKAWNKYFALYKISFKQAWYNKANLSGLLFFLFILIFIYNRLWEVIGIQTGEQGINSTFIWYLLFAEAIILSSPKIERTFFDDIRSGTMAYYINKPISFFLMRYTEALGNMSVCFCLLVGFGSLATLFFTGQPPFKIEHFPLITLMCFLSACLNTLLFAAIGLCGLWLHSIRTLSMAIERLAFIFGGAIFPLTIYPQWFVDIAKWTPFYSIYYQTIKLVYDFSWTNLGKVILLNGFWSLLFISFITYAYSKLNKKVNVYGG